MTRQPHSTKPTQARKAQQGFTLVELLVTVAIMGIIAAIAAPSFSQQLASQRIKSTSSVIEESIRTAISESAIRRQPITYEINFPNKEVILKAPAPPAPTPATPPVTPPPPPKPITIATYNYNDKSEIAFSGFGTGTGVKFQVGPGKLIKSSISGTPANLTLTICDSGISGETAREVSVNALAHIRQKYKGSCS